MKRQLLLAFLLLIGTAASLAADDLFLKLESFFVRPQSTARVYVLNGTFSRSEGAVARDRLRDPSLITPNGQPTRHGSVENYLGFPAEPGEVGGSRGPVRGRTRRSSG